MMASQSGSSSSAHENYTYNPETASLLSHQSEDRQYSSTTKKEESWQVPLSDFVKKRKGDRIYFVQSKQARSYYKAQDELINAYEEISDLSSDSGSIDSFADLQQTKKALFYSQVTFFINFLLMSGKLVAAIFSGSLSIISSLIDSVVDLMSGIIMWWATKAIRNRDPYKYPQGRTKLEPVSIIILSVVMSLASVVFIRESITKIINLVDDPSGLPTMEVSTFVIAGSTVVVKFVLWLVCRRVDSNIVQALALDHRNDVVSNAAALLFGYLGSQEFQDEFDLYGFIYVDPGGAILISIYIIVNWVLLGREQLKLLTGHVADKDVVSKITWAAMNHDRHIRHIETVCAYHSGYHLHVDVHIVMPRDTLLEVAHDVGESLQQKLENMREVERAYVHVDYETTHNPSSEHKQV